MRGLYLGGEQSGQEVEARMLRLRAPCVEFPVLTKLRPTAAAGRLPAPEFPQTERYYRTEPVRIGGELIVFYVHNDFFDEGTAGVVFRALCACLK